MVSLEVKTAWKINSRGQVSGGESKAAPTFLQVRRLTERLMRPSHQTERKLLVVALPSPFPRS